MSKKNSKKREVPGPYGLKSELYKALIEKKRSLNTLTKCLRNEIDRRMKPRKWKKSRTKMLKKVKKPNVQQIRPIALLNISYKVYMSLMKNEMEEHIETNDEQTETQAGFTKGGRMEDNIFILQYCIERSFKNKKGLVVVAVDFSKAYDSIKREELIKVMMDYKMHPDVIQSVADVYREDTTVIDLGYEINEELEVTSGIKQGCTGSTSLFKLITYKIIKELQNLGGGFKDECLDINCLFYADDGLLLAKDIDTARMMINSLIDICNKFGLKINKDKSSILTYNLEHNLEEIAGIKIEDNIKYLGIIIDNKKDMFKTQRNITIKKAEKLAKLTHSVIAKSCNKNNY